MNKMPKWIRELGCFIKIKNCLIIEGNIYDEHPILDETTTECTDFRDLNTYLHKIISLEGYKVCFYDPVNGFYNRNHHSDVVDVLDDFVQALQESATESGDEQQGMFVSEYNGFKEYVETTDKSRNAGVSVHCDPLIASDYIKEILLNSDVPTAFCLNFASRVLADPNRMGENERMIFMNFLYASMNTKRNFGSDRITRQNLFVLIVDKLNDIPTWFYLDNPNAKNIMIPAPDKYVRRMYIDFYRDMFFDESDSTTDDEEKKTQHFVDITDGMKVLDLRGIRELKRVQGVDSTKLSDVVALYKYGIKENPWDSIENERIEMAEDEIRKRVKGQDVAVHKSLSVIKRAKTGLAGLQHSSNAKPKGILFFAGPTGTGKTELAKALAELLFGDENSCRRFDMSEYSESHSAQKLFGAPPGYVGYEAGGQLTNTIKEQPFSLLLFDEIEKASPTIWDKFLQILEDGRMTDGQGNTVYFSESLIVFTSNLGIYEEADGRKKRVVSIDMSYEEVSQKVTEGIQNYFHQKGKPEVLNRIGKNLIVFNFIQPESAKEILRAQISRICNTIKELQKIDISINERVWSVLEEKVLGNLEEGGRGVGNIVEEFFITPLSNYVFDNKVENNKQLIIEDIVIGNDIPRLMCR